MAMEVDMEEDYSSSDEASDLDSDEELQAAFAEGKLEQYRKGLVKPLGAAKENCTNDIVGLKCKIEELEEKDLDWLELMNVTPPTDDTPKGAGLDSTGTNEGEAQNVVNHENDFEREMHFLHQAQRAAIIGLEKLASLGEETVRPNDYFAEMVKTDEHMRKVRQNMVNKQKRIEAAEKAKKLREIKKYGKKVQQEILETRAKDRKQTLQSVKEYRKGKGDKPSFLKTNEEFDLKVESGRSTRNGVKSKRRQMKDTRYGAGGRKKYAKKNTAESTSDMRSFRRNGNNGGQKQHSHKQKKNKRLGKSRRQQKKK